LCGLEPRDPATLTGAAITLAVIGALAARTPCGANRSGGSAQRFMRNAHLPVKTFDSSNFDVDPNGLHVPTPAMWRRQATERAFFNF
jgi:hypothetical protein